MISLLCALLGLGFLILIHEYGHYWMARKWGMTVEVFSIGFGKPIVSWKSKGVKWQLCLFMLGGYVKIAGMEKGEENQKEIPNGFYSFSPWKRMAVAFMGPFVNIVFAVAAFSAVYVMGGREKTFQEFSHYVGSVDPKSDFAKDGLKAGDKLTQIDGRSFTGLKDLMLATVTNSEYKTIRGEHVSYPTMKTSSFAYKANIPQVDDRTNLGITSLAYPMYVTEMGSENVPYNRYLSSHGVEKGQRLMWANGSFIFSNDQLRQVLNAEKALLTVKREGELQQLYVPVASLADLPLSDAEKEHLLDLKLENKIRKGASQLLTLNSTFNAKGYITSSSELLQKGDQVVAVWGEPVSSGGELLEKLQHKKGVFLFDASDQKSWNYDSANEKYFDSFANPNIQKALSQLGSGTEVFGSVRFVIIEELKKLSSFLKEVAPKQYKQEALTQDPFVSGFLFTQQRVLYNPTPVVMVKDVFDDFKFTLSSLFTGSVSAKYASGPIGMIKVMQMSWKTSGVEALFWLALISFNLAVFNLLPIPVLDGGHICFSLWEAITKKRITRKQIERITYPFMVALIAFIVYVTYHDVVRVF